MILSDEDHPGWVGAFLSDTPARHQPQRVTNPRSLHVYVRIQNPAHCEEPKITADIYTNIFADVDRAAAEAVAQLVPRTTTPDLGI